MKTGIKKETILKINKKFETIIISILLFVLMFIVLLLTAEFIMLLISGLDTYEEITSIELLQKSAQSTFAGFLLVLLGIELMQTVKMYLTENKIHVEIVLVVAMIAVGRHIIQLDFHHEDPLTLIGIAALVSGLAFGYFLIKKARFKQNKTEMEE